MIRRLTLAASIAAITAAVPTLGHAEFDPECGRQGPRPVHAEFLQPEDGMLVVEHPVGSVVVGTGDPAALGTGVVLSTNGTITVEIGHGCMDQMRLRVTKDGNPIHAESFDTTCEEQTTTTTVNIGLDAGEYEFHLEGLGCNGAPIVPTSNGHYVGDPPLPV